MLIGYRTIANTGTRDHEIEIEIKKSHFIARIARVRDEESARAFITARKKQYWDANHNCSAWIVGERGQLQRSSDDGEPSGTAGIPMLSVLQRNGLTDVVVVVTRYFGGTKLGTGGLVKAYTQAAKALIELVGLAEREPGVSLRLEYPYPLAGSLEHWYRQQGLEPELSYTTHISASLQIPASRLPAAEATLQEWSHQGLSWRRDETD